MLVLLALGEARAQSDAPSSSESEAGSRADGLAQPTAAATPAESSRDVPGAQLAEPSDVSRAPASLSIEPVSYSAAPPTAAVPDARGAWPIAAALVLGPVAHGAGHFVAGQTGTGWKLLAAEGVGVLATVAGLAGLAVTGASEKTTAPLAGLAALGVGLFATSWFADVYGVVTPPGGFGAPVLRPALVAEAGLYGVVDPVFDYNALSHVSGRAFLERHSLALEGHFGVDHSNQRLRGIYAYRFIECDAATYLEAELGAVHHRYGPEQFSMTFAEAAISGRLALGRVAPTLQGAFVDGAFGIAFGGHRYFDLVTESDSMLLMRVAFGFFIGDGGSWSLYYDHRHDGYTGGLKMSGLGSGVIGHIGTALQYYFSPAWGVAVRAETGSAHMIGASLLFRRKRW